MGTLGRGLLTGFWRVGLGYWIALAWGVQGLWRGIAGRCVVGDIFGRGFRQRVAGRILGNGLPVGLFVP